MNQLPLGLRSTIAISAAATLVYLASIALGFPIQSIFFLCLLAMISIGWMALRILKDPFATDKTFDACFYLDRPDIERTESNEREL